MSKAFFGPHRKIAVPKSPLHSLTMVGQFSAYVNACLRSAIPRSNEKNVSSHGSWLGIRRRSSTKATPTLGFLSHSFALSFQLLDYP